MTRMLENLLMVLGWVSLVVGAIGIFVPLLPTTPFLLLSAALFSKGSPKSSRWIRSRPWIAGPLQKWENERIIPLPVKVVASVSLVASLWIAMPGLRALHVWMPVFVGALFFALMLFLWRQRSR